MSAVTIMFNYRKFGTTNTCLSIENQVFGVVCKRKVFLEGRLVGGDSAIPVRCPRRLVAATLGFWGVPPEDVLLELV